MRRIARFTLGPFARKISDEEFATYQQLLNELIIKVYANRLGEYGNEKVVVGRSQSKKKNFIVNSQIEFDNGRQPIAVDWWLYREKDGGFSLFDVRVIGVWMAQEQRDSFASVLKNNRGDISALLGHIRKQIKAEAAQNLTVKLLVFDALWHLRLGAQTAFPVFFIISVIALKPLNMAIAFKGQNMRCNAVEKPSVMAYHHRAAGKVFQPFFQRAQCLNIQIIGRFIEQQEVGTAFQHFRQMHAIAFTTRQEPHFFLLVAATEIESPDIGARIHFPLAKLQNIQPAGNFLPHGLVVLQIVAALVDIAQHRVPDPQISRIGRFGAGQHLKQRRLASTIWADNPDNAARRKAKRQIVDKQAITNPLLRFSASNTIPPNRGPDGMVICARPTSSRSWLANRSS